MALSVPQPSQSRRSKTILSPEGVTAKFLYTIIKQLDLKTIDWNEVASQLEISNGHAARMRYSRFKSQIEVLLKDSKSTTKVTVKDTKMKQKSKGKRSYDDLQLEQPSTNNLFMEDDGEMRRRIKPEFSVPQMHLWNDIIKVEKDLPVPNTTAIGIKSEQGVQHTRLHQPAITNFNQTKSQSESVGGVQPGHTDTQAPCQKPTLSTSSMYPELPMSSATVTNLPLRSHYQQYYPQVNNAQQMFPRQLSFRQYQGMMPYYGHHPRMHYQQSSYPSMYRPSAYEMAVQGSYPWPYSESDVSRYAKQDATLGFNTNANSELIVPDDIDFGKFATEYGDVGAETNSRRTSDENANQELTVVSCSETSSSRESVQECNGHNENVLHLDSTVQAGNPRLEQSARAQSQFEAKAALTGGMKVTSNAEHAMTTTDDTRLNKEVAVKVEPDVLVL